MNAESNRLSVSKQDIAILSLFSFSYLLGAISFWLFISFPLSNGVITLYKIILATAAALSIAFAIGLIFLHLARLFVIDPIREDLDNAMVEFDGESLRYNPETAPDDFEIPQNLLDHMGYANMATTDQEQDGGDLNREDEGSTST